MSDSRITEGHCGFTLIEITMVLVLLGILAAVAVPKFFDLQEEAEQKAVLSSAAEVQARLEATFSRQVLEGVSCSEARKFAAKIENLADDGVKSFGEFSFKTEGEGQSGSLGLKYSRGDDQWKEVAGFSLVLPQCSADESAVSPTFSQAGLDIWKSMMNATFVKGPEVNKENDPYKFCSWSDGQDYYWVQSQNKAAIAGLPGSAHNDVRLGKNRKLQNKVEKVIIGQGPYKSSNDNLLEETPGEDAANRNARIEIFKTHCANWDTLFEIRTSKATRYQYLVAKYPEL